MIAEYKVRNPFSNVIGKGSNLSKGDTAAEPTWQPKCCSYKLIIGKVIRYNIKTL